MAPGRKLMHKLGGYFFASSACSQNKHSDVGAGYQPALRLDVAHALTRSYKRGVRIDGNLEHLRLTPQARLISIAFFQFERGCTSGDTKGGGGGSCFGGRRRKHDDRNGAMRGMQPGNEIGGVLRM